ncbi:MAG: hypothetical protein V1888_03845 [archaeon]
MVRKNLSALVAGFLMLVETSLSFGGNRDLISYLGGNPLVYDGGNVIVDAHLNNLGVYLFGDGKFDGAKIYGEGKLPKFFGVESKGSAVVTLPYDNGDISCRYTIDSKVNIFDLDVGSRFVYSDNGNKILKWESYVGSDFFGGKLEGLANGNNSIGCTQAELRLTIPLKENIYIRTMVGQEMEAGVANFSFFLNGSF